MLEDDLAAIWGVDVPEIVARVQENAPLFGPALAFRLSAVEAGSVRAQHPEAPVGARHRRG